MWDANLANYLRISIDFVFELTVDTFKLVPRDVVVTNYVAIGIGLSFVLIVSAKLVNNQVYLGLFSGVIKVFTQSFFEREGGSNSKGHTLILLLNYIVAAGLVVSLFPEIKGRALADAWMQILLFPTVVLAWHLLCLKIGAFITGEASAFHEPIQHKIIGTQILGVLFFVVALFEVLYSGGGLWYEELIFWIVCIEFVVRIVKSLIATLTMGVSWYYIILYFCTLEILPLFVTYYVLF